MCSNIAGWLFQQGPGLGVQHPARQFAALQLISEEPDAAMDSTLAERCATFIIENSQSDRVVDLLACGEEGTNAIFVIFLTGLHVAKA